MEKAEIKSDPKSWLASVLAQFDCSTGTLHRASERRLSLVVAIGVPDQLLSKIDEIPFGKGIAGAAAERGEPVELCNLQQDLEGVAVAKARETKVAGSLAIPIFSSGREVVGTLGIGKHEPYDFAESEVTRLQKLAKEVAEEWAN